VGKEFDRKRKNQTPNKISRGGDEINIEAKDINDP
jgi:hypothetical protein